MRQLYAAVKQLIINRILGAILQPDTNQTSRQHLRSRLVLFHWLAICRLLIVKIGINAGHKRRTLANREIESPD